MELEALQEVINDINSAGATLITISPQRKEHLRQLIKKHSLTFDMLSDRGNIVASNFGLVFTLPDYLKELYIKFGIDLERFNGDDSWTLPIPASFIVDKNSTIINVNADPDYTVRPEPAQTITILNQLKER